MKAVRQGNFWGLPINFLAFSIVTVITTSATLPVFGHLITDPVETVGKIDSPLAVVIGAMTFTIATIGINIVANFVSPAFDFSNVAPSRISWRTGGMIAAVASVFITPWNLFNNPAVIHNTLDILACAIGPLYGILLVDYYRLKKQKMVLEDLYTMSPSGAYWYSHGFNLSAVYALIGASLISFLCVMVPAISWLANFSWFIGVLASALFYRMLTLGVKSAETPDMVVAGSPGSAGEA
jgi:NCS1 family nucleobase:cation symporter-1